MVPRLGGEKNTAIAVTERMMNSDEGVSRLSRAALSCCASSCRWRLAPSASIADVFAPAALRASLAWG
jgi:hypothetical protein